MPKIKIIYKSGYEQIVKCDRITVTRSGGDLTEVKWENMSPSPLFLGIDDIAAIFELKA